MLFWFANLAAVAAAYLCGSLPTAYLVGKLFFGLDIREHGSKSVGATNALRVLGKGPGLAVLLADVAKGAAAVFVMRGVCGWLFAQPSIAAPAGVDAQTWTAWALCLAGLAALLGHSYSIWLGFSGGKSVATGLGVVLAIAWPVALGALAVFGVAVLAWRMVSLGSILAALTAIALVLGLGEPLPYRLLVVAGAVFVIVRHRANIGRLMAGTEPRVGRSQGR